MTCLDLTLPTPAENLACDEALLDYCEAGGAEGWLRFWEAESVFVVVGYANPVATEVNVPACERAGVPVFRRCSGGGTVLQGPGCLNYSLVLKIEPGGPLNGIASANRFIMERQRAAIQRLLGSETGLRNPPPVPKPGSAARLEVAVQGHTDLAIHGRKFSGNAQRRRRHFLLFHGTFLLRFDLALVDTLLRMPARRPEYRRDRTHGDFLMNLDRTGAAVKRALREAWQADGPPGSVPRGSISKLARDKYVTPEWNFKF